MKAISIKQPWASMICIPNDERWAGFLPKRVENRHKSQEKYYKHHSGELLIHSPAGIDNEFPKKIEDELEQRGIRIKDLPRSAIIGKVQVECSGFNIPRKYQCLPQYTEYAIKDSFKLFFGPKVETFSESEQIKIGGKQRLWDYNLSTPAVKLRRKPSTDASIDLTEDELELKAIIQANDSNIPTVQDITRESFLEAYVQGNHWENFHFRILNKFFRANDFDKYSDGVKRALAPFIIAGFLEAPSPTIEASLGILKESPLRCTSVESIIDGFNSGWLTPALVAKQIGELDRVFRHIYPGRGIYPKEQFMSYFLDGINTLSDVRKVYYFLDFQDVISKGDLTKAKSLLPPEKSRQIGDLIQEYKSQVEEVLT